MWFAHHRIRQAHRVSSAVGNRTDNFALNLREMASVIPQNRICARRQLYTASSHIHLSPYKEAPRDSTRYRALREPPLSPMLDKGSFFLPLIRRRKSFRTLQQGHRQPTLFIAGLIRRPDFAPVTLQWLSPQDFSQVWRAYIDNRHVLTHWKWPKLYFVTFLDIL